MKCIIPNQLLNSLLLDIKKPKIFSYNLFNLNKKFDLENAELNLYMYSYLPSHYVAQEELFFFPIANMMNDIRSTIPTLLIECDIELCKDSIRTESIYDKDYLLYTKTNKFRATNFKYLTFENICYYFSLTDKYLEKHPNLGINKEDLLDAFTFCVVLNNDLSLLEMIVKKYNVSLMPKNRPYSFISDKNYEYLLYAFKNLNKDMIKFIIDNSTLRVDSEPVRRFITSTKSIEKLKTQILLFKYFTSKKINIDDFKGFFGKLRYLRCLL